MLPSWLLVGRLRRGSGGVCTTYTYHHLFHVFYRRRECIYLRHQMGNWGNGSIQSQACHTQPHV